MIENPFTLFDNWYQDAERTEPRDPNAMSLATLGADGRLSNRVVLMKGHDAHSFSFFTNTQSQKGAQLAATPFAALCFHWKSLNRQIRIEGRVEPVSADEADAYYKTRPRGSRIGAWASAQSQPLPDRETLVAQVEAYTQKFADIDDIPRPPHWSGYRVVADRMEFWEEQPFRLHSRTLYTLNNASWNKTLLYP